MATAERKVGKRRRLPGGTKGVKRPLPTKPSRGRPSLLTTRVADKICGLVSQGKPESVAAEAVGVHRNTLSGWYARGCADIEEGLENQYTEFAYNLNRARALGVCSRMDKIDQCCEGGQLVRKKVGFDRNGNEIVDETYTAPDWRGHAFVLETTRSDLFSKQRRIDHSGTIRQENMNVTLSGNLDDAQLIALARLAQQIRTIPAEPTSADSEGQSQPASQQQ